MGVADPAMPGEKWGRLTVIADLGTFPGKGREVHCQCQCGERRTLPYKSLKSGNTKSCGCLRREYVADKNTIHGLAHKVPEYTIWKRMRQRCNDPNNHEWERYGGRGISVCGRWDDFEKFLEDVGSRPSRTHSIDRFPNVNGNYEPGNVRWATLKEQARNKRNSRFIELNGVRVTMAEWSERTGIPSGVISRRIAKGMSPAEALTIGATNG